MAFPPEVWAVVAAFTRSKRSISRIGRVCKKSHKGVTKSVHPWRALERKYGIQPAEDPERARENTMRYVKERRLVKRGLENFAHTGHLVDRAPRLRPTGLRFWERRLHYLKRDPDFYHVFLTALLDKPVVDTVPTREQAELTNVCDQIGKPLRETPLVLQTPRTLRGGGAQPEMDMTMLCAVYTAVCKPGTNILVLYTKDYNMYAMRMRIDTFLQGFDGASVEGLPPPNWVRHTERLENSKYGAWMHLRNSSSIILCSTDDPLPRVLQFDGVIGPGTGIRPLVWLLEPTFPFPKHYVDFTVPHAD